ncbi:YecA family protein [Calidifontimicrobium sp. SYSU G02091]|uniref:YecA/YgfB family protein n=1 Tax=Calidifontimicrobium sp. SYSU G02091 TaxID=2926421 RepID=UPI001F53794C|nr:YecA family protein [Calidifontimicrobium sp. SYSU G02091]MCI1191651.1 YecA family protein [Calidifontimicrobium sp. SYSU G02091]
MDAPPLSDAEIDELQRRLDALPPPLEPLDVTMLDGYLVGVLLQPRPVPAAQWLRFVHDSEGCEPPQGLSLERVHTLVRRRHAELDRAIARRDWFDPWVYELDDDATPSQTVLPWVAGFALAMAHFPALMALDGAALTEPLAVLYQHLDPDDLEDADELLAEIETLEPPRDLAEAVEGLVNSTLRLADVSRPRSEPRRPRPAAKRTRRR